MPGEQTETNMLDQYRPYQWEFYRPQLITSLSLVFQQGDIRWLQYLFMSYLSYIPVTHVVEPSPI